jgi:hypothetical protein
VGRVTRFLVVSALLAGAVSGCSTDDPSPDSSAESRSSPPSPDPGEGAPVATHSLTPLAGLAVPEGLPDDVDTSPEAAAVFQDWVEYEAEAPGDSQGVERDIFAGYNACLWSSPLPRPGADAVLARLKSDMGYVNTGPNAILRAALVALCPNYDLGYLTPLDKHVDSYRTSLSGLMSIDPERTPREYGRMLTAVCQDMRNPLIPGTAILGDIYDRIGSGELTLVSLPLDYHYLVVLIKRAVYAHCSEHIISLPEPIMNEPNS